MQQAVVARPEDWLYSNYREWIGSHDSLFVDKTFAQDHFSSADEYVRFVNDVEDEKKSYEKIRKYMFD